MPGSYHKLVYHFVWSTKYRAKRIEPDVKPRLYGFIRHKAEGLGARVLALGGVEDHVHLLVSMSPRVAPADFIANVKGSSSHFMNHEVLGQPRFYWQDGYGVLSVSYRDRIGIIRYVENQVEHHNSAKLVSSLEIVGDESPKSSNHPTVDGRSPGEDSADSLTGNSITGG